MDSIHLVQPPQAVFEAVRRVYAERPWSTTLEVQDLGGLLYELKYLPYRPLLRDVHGAVEALVIEQGRDVAELPWTEVRTVFGFKLLEIRSKATSTLNSGVVRVEE